MAGKKVVLSALSFAALSLSGCDFPAQERLEVVADQADAVAAAYADVDLSDPPTMPTSGSATYNGLAGLAVNKGGGMADAYAGRAEFTANFTGAGGTISGEFTDFVQQQDVRTEDITAFLASAKALRTQGGDAGQLAADFFVKPEAVEGNITVRPAAIAGAYFAPTFAGSIQGASDITVAGSGDGFFFGERGEVLSVEATTDEKLVVTRNGAAASGQLIALGAQ